MYKVLDKDMINKKRVNILKKFLKETSIKYAGFVIFMLLFQ